MAQYIEIGNIPENGEAVSLPMRVVSRRSFIVKSVKGMIIFCSGPAAIASFSGCTEKSPTENEDPAQNQTTILIDITLPDYSDLQAVGGKLALDGEVDERLPVNGILIMRESASAFLVLDRTCTHEGCQVNGFDDQQMVICPCHNSQFDRFGSVLQGPAEQALRSYEASLTGNILEVIIDCEV